MGELLENVIEFVIAFVVPVLELMGIFIVAEAALVSFGRYLYCLVTRNRVHVKGRLAVGLLLGLEFMMTAEILKTIVVRDTKELLILGGAWLIFRRIITWHIPVSYIGTVAVLTFLFPRGNDPVQWMLYNLLGGGLMLGAFFMATDYVTSPVSHLGQAIFGIGCGLITVFIRYFGSYSEGVCYAILIMNLTVWIIDKNVKPRRFGVVKEKKPARAPDNTKKEAAKK